MSAERDSEASAQMTFEKRPREFPLGFEFARRKRRMRKQHEEKARRFGRDLRAIRVGRGVAERSRAVHQGGAIFEVDLFLPDSGVGLARSSRPQGYLTERRLAGRRLAGRRLDAIRVVETDRQKERERREVRGVDRGVDAVDPKNALSP